MIGLVVVGCLLGAAVSVVMPVAEQGDAAGGFHAFEAGRSQIRAHGRWRWPAADFR